MATPLPKIEEMTDILDLKEFAIWDLGWFWTVLTVALAIFLAWGLYFYFKRHHKKMKDTGPPKTPIEEALERLQELVARGLVEGGQIRQFYFGLSEIFRDFLEQELRISAKEATLQELKPLLKGCQDFTQEELKETYWLLEASDLAKFAKVIPPKEDILRSVKSCRVLMITLARRREIPNVEVGSGLPEVR